MKEQKKQEDASRSKSAGRNRISQPHEDSRKAHT